MRNTSREAAGKKEKQELHMLWHIVLWFDYGIFFCLLWLPNHGIEIVPFFIPSFVGPCNFRKWNWKQGLIYQRSIREWDVCLAQCCEQQSPKKELEDVQLYSPWCHIAIPFYCPHKNNRSVVFLSEIQLKINEQLIFENAFKLFPSLQKRRVICQVW